VTVDDFVTDGYLPRVIGHALTRQSLQIVYIIQSDFLELACGRIDIARHGQIDEQQRSIAPRLHQIFDVVENQQSLPAARRSDDNIGIAHFEKAITETNRVSAASGSQIDCAIEGSIRNEDRAHTFLDEELNTAFGHFAGADHHY